MPAVLEFRFDSCRAPAFRRFVPPRGPERLRRARPTDGSRAGNSAPGHSFTVAQLIFTALPLLTGPKGTPANILLRSAMVLSGRAAQDMEAGSSSFPGLEPAASICVNTREWWHRKSRPPALHSFDEINVFILAQIHAYRIGARSVGVGATEVEHTGAFGRDGDRKRFAGSEIGDNCLW